MEDMTKKLRMERALMDAIEIAQNGTIEEKENFVEWCAGAIGFWSARAAWDKEAREHLAEVKEMYRLYLKNYKPVGEGK